MARKKEEKTKKIRVAPFITILFFLVMGMIGIMNGEVGRVLAQAVQVCLSCIGIG
ncbi:MAG: CD1871A family CXXC motif-containing protein [Desulfobulbaceae bacterium]|nr:CD1871A family CXXC motif-containing protein [Desulfobulbaceae bacterium]